MELKVSRVGNSRYALLPAHICEEHIKDGKITVFFEPPGFSLQDFKEDMKGVVEQAIRDAQA